MRTLFSLSPRVRTGATCPARRSSLVASSVRFAALLAVLTALPAMSRAQDTGGKPDGAADAGTGDDEHLVVIRAGKIIPIVGDELDNGMIVLVNGRVRNIGRALEFPRNAKVIDARDRVVMPGLINPVSRFDQPRYSRSGVQAHLTVADEYFQREDGFEPLLRAGYTTVGLVPAGDGIPGRAMILRTGGPPEQRELQRVAYVWVNGDKKALLEALQRAKKEIEKVDKAREEFEKKQKETPKAAPASAPASAPATQPASAPATQPAFEPPKIEPAYQPLVDLIQKKEGVVALIELGGGSDYLHARQVLSQFEIAHKFVVRNNVQTDLQFVLDTLREDKPALVLWPFLHQVQFSTERINLVRDIAATGCEVTISPIGDSSASHNEIFERLAELVANGWDRAAALKSVTLQPAKLLGIDLRLGSIEKDKDADFIFLNRDPLEPLARVREVMIAGEIVHEVEDVQ